MERVRYTFFQEERDDPEAGRHTTYGIAAFRDGEAAPVKTLRGISPDRKKVAKLVYVLNLTRLPADYLEYTVESLLE